MAVLVVVVVVEEVGVRDALVGGTLDMAFRWAEGDDVDAGIEVPGVCEL